MTDYVNVECMQEGKPLEIDTDSSPSVVYQRQNIVEVDAVGTEGDVDYNPKHWEYEERTMTRTEYAQYVIAMEQANEINEHSTEAAIDEYTMQLIEEGVLL